MIGRYIKKQGYIYCLDNECYKYISENMYKIGQTQNIKERLRSYNSIFIDKCENKYTIEVNDKELGEKIIFIKLEKYRIIETRELFICDIEIIKKAFDKTKVLLENEENNDEIFDYLEIERKEIKREKLIYYLDKILKKILLEGLQKKNEYFEKTIKKEKSLTMEDIIMKNPRDYKPKNIEIIIDEIPYKILEYWNIKQKNSLDLKKYKTNKIEVIREQKKNKGKISFVHPFEFDYYNKNVYKISYCVKDIKRNLGTPFIYLKVREFYTSNIEEGYILINKLLKDNIFCKNHYIIYDIDSFVERIKYLIKKKRIIKYSNNYSEDTENEEDIVNTANEVINSISTEKIEENNSIISTEKIEENNKIEIVINKEQKDKIPKVKKLKGLFIDTKY